MAEITRLYGGPDDEDLCYDLEEAAERAWDRNFNPSGKVVIYEYTVQDPIRHLPDVDRLLDWLHEYVAESGDVLIESDDPLIPLGDHSVQFAAKVLLDMIAKGIHWRMADQKVAEHVVEWEESGVPMLNGLPLYKERTHA